MISTDGMAKGTRSSRWRIVAGVVAIAVLSVIGLAVWLKSKSHPAQRSTQPRVAQVVQITNDGFPKSNLVGDGARLYFNEMSDRGLVLMKIDITAGNRTTIIPSSVTDAKILDVSEGSELLVSSGAAAKGGPLWFIPLSNAMPRRLGNISGHSGAWAPDGKVVFSLGNVLYQAQHDGTNPQKLITAAGPILFVRFSPDGSLIRHTVGLEGKSFMIWQARADASQMRPILPPPGRRQVTKVCCGTWTRDAKYFVYEDGGDVWLVSNQNESVSNPIRLTSGPQSFHDPVSSGDGRIIFAIGEQRAQSEGVSTQEIYAIHLRLR